MVFLILLLTLATGKPCLASAEKQQSSSWTCEKSHWLNEPQLIDDIFTATIETDCQILVEKENGIPWLLDKIQSEYLRKEKYIIHEGPKVVLTGAKKVFFYDLTDKLSEEDSDLSIRQNVELITDEQTELAYSTQSTEIRASGTAAYLKEVHFKTQIKKASGHYNLKLENRVIIQKPWFAFSFLFKPLSASITEEKFIKARETLIHHLLSDS